MYLFMRGFRNFLRDFKSNIVTFISIITLIILFNIFNLTSVVISSFLSSTTSVDSIRVYMLDADKGDISKLSTDLTSFDGVVDVQIFLPSDSKKFIEENTSNINGLDKFSEQFFPTFIDVKLDADGIKSIKSLKEEMYKLSNVEFVSYGEKVLGKFFQIKLITNVFIIVLLILVCLSLASVIFNATRISLYKYNEEMKVYLLVGGTRPFISMPYIFSSMITSLVTSILAIIIFIMLSSFLNSLLVDIDIFIKMPPVWHYIFQIIILNIFSLISSSISVVLFIKRVSSVNDV